MMNVMAVISNTALIAVSPKGTELMDVYGEVQFIILLVLAEVRLNSNEFEIQQSIWN